MTGIGSVAPWVAAKSRAIQRCASSDSAVLYVRRMADELVMRSIWNSLKGPRMPPASSPTTASCVALTRVTDRGEGRRDGVEDVQFSVASHLRPRSALLLATD
jgi:hypothetical protein